MMVLTSSLEDPAFNLNGIAVVNTIVQYTYIGTVVGCFLISLGNRPQGSVTPCSSALVLTNPRSVWKYRVAIVLLALTTAYMYAAAAFCIVAAVKASRDSIIFTEIILSLVATCSSLFSWCRR